LKLPATRIYGRGTTDMKGFIAQCLDAARTLDATNSRGVVFVFTAERGKSMPRAHHVAPALRQILGRRRFAARVDWRADFLRGCVTPQEYRFV